MTPARKGSRQAAITGAGSVGFAKSTEESVVQLAARALRLALEDCGLARADVDALFVHIGSPRGLDYDLFARLLGLEVSYVGQTWSHGRFTATLIQQAAFVLEAGLADCALCLGAFRNSPFNRHGTTAFPDFAEALREGGGPHAEQPASGLAAPIGGAALSTQRYLEQYGIAREMLGAVPLAQRKAAALNPEAVMREEISAADYAASPFVVEPLRRLDCSVPVDTAVAVLLTPLERARSLRTRPVRLAGFQGIHAGANEFVFGKPGLGIGQRDARPVASLGAEQAVFGRAGIAPTEVGSLYCYDGFAPQVLWTLERFGFCPEGEAAEWTQGGRIELDGALPVNTNGGHLSEGHSNGWGQTVEIVRQLRGEAGERQVKGRETAMWATTLGDAIVYAA